MGGGEEASYSKDCHPRWAGDSLRGLHQMEIAINSSSPLGWSQTHREHVGVRNVTIVSVKNATPRQNSIFRNWEVILSSGLAFVFVCVCFNSLCTLTIQSRTRSRGETRAQWGARPGFCGC